jgi:hypothetical protein
MELVDGLPLQQFLARHSLSFEQRARLWLQIVDAVAHAHRRGVLHRDLKPQNVLVAGTADSPQCKVLDFGIGRSLDASTPTLTLTGQLLGTLEYMSPEQFRGDPRACDVRSDVWALGAIGYELCAGKPPFALRDLPLVDAARLVATTPATPLGRHAAVPDDLASVVHQCLRIEPDARYPTAHDLATDLQRWLAGEPVTAHGYSTLLQIRWLLRRHLAVCASVGSILLTLVTATVVSLQLYFTAEAERAAAAEVTSFLTEDVIGGADPITTSGQDRTLREAARRAHERLAGRFADAPRVRAEITKVLGETFLSLGEWADARTLLSEAATLHERHVGPTREATFHSRARLCECLDRLGDATALPERERLLADLRQGLGPDHVLAIKTLDGIAHTCRTNGDLQRSRTLHQEAIERATRALGPEHSVTLVARNNLALTESALGQSPLAAAIHHDVWTIRQRVLGQDHPNTIASRANYALALWYDRDTPGYDARLVEAEQHTAEALRDRERVLGRDHPETLLSMNNLVLVQMDRKDLVAAVATGRDLCGRYRAKLGDEHEDTLRAMANFLDVLCRTEDRNQWLEAKDLSATTLANARRRYDAGNWMLGWHLMCAGVPLLRLQQDLDRARDMTIEALGIYRRTLGDGHARTRGAAKRLVVRGREFGWTVDPEWERLAGPK